MRLTELNPRWLGHGGHGITNSATGEPVPYTHGAGISFDCPCGCGKSIAILFNNPLDGSKLNIDNRTYWDRTGDTFETLTLNPSISNRNIHDHSEHWHGWIKNGEVIKC